MESFISPVRVANAIMLDTTFDGHYLVVEGKKDTKVYGKFIDKDTVRIREAFGCKKVVEVIDILKGRGFDRSAGIIDADFSTITGEPIPSCVYVTDDHDIEMTIAKTTAIEIVIDSFAGCENVAEFCKRANKKLRNIIFDACWELACLKLANKKFGLGLVFKPDKPEGNQIKYKNFINDKDLSYLGRDKLVTTAINYSRNKSKNIQKLEVIMAKLDEVASVKYDPYQLLNGHDISNTVFIFLTSALKVKNPVLVDFNAVEECLAMTFDFCFFSKTSLYQSLISWAEARSIDIFKECYK